MPNPALARMVEEQIVRRGLRDPAVLDAMRSVPRAAFVRPGFEAAAYDDGPLPIGEGQTLSQPYIVALMAEAAGLRPGARVLEVGAGSGYAAAVLAALGAEVHAIERQPALAEAARMRLARLGYGRVALRTGDGSAGWPEAAPFDAILVSAGAPAVPRALKAQLALGGRLVAPVGPAGAQTLVVLTRRGADLYAEEDRGPVSFVPLIGAEGWPEEGAWPGPA
ncbi:protein-L-isoaspartate(D-aspartate) O-methyltransferase [Methylobacterium dankookense]|nr:protein-L-isoaspartate(D-aspartate) O-methyltransferase [Methylobacterium dankookense]